MVGFTGVHFLFGVFVIFTYFTLVQENSLEMLALNVVSHICSLGVFEDRTQGAVEVTGIC